MGRKKIDENKLKKTRTVRINDVNEMLLSKEFKTRQKALNFLIDFLEVFPKKAKFYKEQIDKTKNN